MSLWGLIILLLSAILWFLAGFSIYGNPVLGPIFGGTWQKIYMLTGVIGLFLIVAGFAKKKPSVPSASSISSEKIPKISKQPHAENK